MMVAFDIFYIGLRQVDELSHHYGTVVTIIGASVAND